MDSARWNRIQTLFHDTADLPEPERRAFLETACGGDESLVSEVLALLDEDSRRTSLLDQDVAYVAHRLVGQGAAPSPAIKEVGRYRLGKLLGEGGMGVVYFAERADLGGQVAVKVLRDAWLSPARRERFALEQRTLAQLIHPSIARLYDADTLADGTPWFAMEYVEGVPLTEYCARHECSIRERLRLFRAVCEAVQYAHQQAIVHRDLKPSNILVKSDGTIRLLDFGIAKQLDGLGAPADRTRTGLRLMTPAYAAPEQVRGEQVGIQSDVYSLGVILYELLAGRLPFDWSNRTPAEAERMIAEQEPGKPSAAAERLPAGRTAWADLDVLCLTAMHQDPQRRYRSVEALIRDIDHFLAGEPLESRPDTLRYRLGKFVRRHRRAVAAAAFGLTAIIAVVVFFTVRLAIARNAALAGAVRAQRVEQFMENLFEGGDKEAGPAENLRVVTLLDRGVQQARNLDAEPAAQADLYLTLGSLYQKLGKFDRADSLLQSALDQRRKLFGADHAEVAECLVALSLLRVDQAKLEDAERLVRQGLEMTRRHNPPGHPAVAKATVALGQVLQARGAYAKAIPVLEEAVRLLSRPEAAPSDLAAGLHALADTQFYAGHYDISESLNQRVLALHRRLYGERHPLIAEDLINLGAIQFEHGNYPPAEQFFRQALEIDRAFYGQDHPETASAMTRLGQALTFENRFDEAVDLLQQALAIRERVYGPVHPNVASTLNELGSVALQRGKLDEAESRFRRMADIYRAVYGEHHYLLALALSNLASVYLQRKEYARAEQLFRDVVRRYTEALSADHSYTAIAQIKLGRALVRQQHYQEAESHTLAGYQILKKQADPAVSYLRAARQDLAEIYDALHQPEKAQAFRAELADAQAAARGK